MLAGTAPMFSFQIINPSVRYLTFVKCNIITTLTLASSVQEPSVAKLEQKINAGQIEEVIIQVSYDNILYQFYHLPLYHIL